VSLDVRRIDRTFGERMLEIDRACPIRADFTLFFDRAPDFFAWPDAVFERCDYVGGFERDRLAAFGLIGFTRGFTGGQGSEVCYAGDLRALTEVRGQRFAVRSVEKVAEFVSPDVRLGFALVKQGNRQGERVLSAVGTKEVVFEPLTSFETHSVLLHRRFTSPRHVRVRRAGNDDIPALAALMQRAFAGRLFAPIVTPDELRRDITRLPGFGIDRYYLAFAGSELVGALGAWDMAPVRRAVVLRYSPRGTLLRWGYQAWRVMGRGAPLPVPGAALGAITTTRVAVPSGDPDVLRDLLCAVGDEHVGTHHLLHVGFVGDDPLRAATRGLLKQRLGLGVSVIRTRDAAIPTGRPYVDLRFL
jgi:hypothetical protein